MPFSYGTSGKDAPNPLSYPRVANQKTGHAVVHLGSWEDGSVFSEEINYIVAKTI